LAAIARSTASARLKVGGPATWAASGAARDTTAAASVHRRRHSTPVGIADKHSIAFMTRATD
jgi:hypothetical protein